MKPKSSLRSFPLSAALAALLAISSASAETTVSLNFESQSAGSSTVPTGWSYRNSGLGTAGTYVTTAANGGSTGAGLGGSLVSTNGTHGTRLPHSFLVNSGSAAGFDLNRPISGTYDFKHTHFDSYDSSAFLFGDISGGTISGTNAGQLLLAYHSNGGFGNAPSHIVNGANANLVSGGGTYDDNTWYRVSFTWTPTSGTTGNFTRTSTVWNGSSFVAHGTLSATGFTFANPEAFIGVADLWATNTTFDNISATGTEWSGVYWDTNGATAGAGNPADGTWDATTKWNSKSAGTDPTAAWTAGDVAVFAAGSDAVTPYTVTVSGTQDISGLIFQEGTPTLTGGTLRMVSNSYANVTTAGTSAEIASSISDDGSARVLSTGTAGTLVLSGDNSGATNSSMIIFGVTQFNASNSILGTGENVTINTGGVMVFGSSFVDTNIAAALDRIVTTSAGTIAADNYASTNFDFNTAGLTAAPLGALGNVSYTGTLTPQDNTYRLGGGGGTLTMANTNAVTGAGKSLVVQGNVVLAGANDYDSGTTLSSGTLTLGNAGSLGAGGLTIAGGTTIAASGTVATTNTIAANGDFSIGGTGTLTLGGSMALNANRIITNNNTTNTTTYGAISGNTRTLTFSGNGSNTVSGNITTTTGTLTKNGAGILTLGGANTYSGTTTADGGTLVLSGSNSSAGATTINAATLRLDSSSNGGLASGTLSLSNNSSVLQAINADRAISNNVTVGANPTISGSQSLTINGTVTLNDNRTLTNNISGTGKLLTLSNITRDGSNNRNLVLGGTGDTTVNGTVVLGTGTFTKSGNGTVTLNNNATYTGATTVSQGTLQFDGSLSGAGGAVGVAGGTLGVGASATIARDVNLSSGAVNLAGAVAGKLTVTGGTVTTSGTTPSVTIADFSAPGAGTVVASTPLAITSTLKMGTTTATLTVGSSFTAQGTNLASSSTASTLTLSGGTLALSAAAGQVFVPLTNPSFETDAGTANNFKAVPSITGWTNVTTGTYIEQGSSRTFTPPAAPPNYNASTNFKWAVLQGAGTFSQTINVTTAGNYTVGFAAAARTGAFGPLDMSVQIDSTNVLAQFIPSQTAWNTYTSTPLALSAGSHTLTFNLINRAGGDKSSVLDAVSVTAPVPSSLNLPAISIAATASSTLDLGTASANHTLGALSIANSSTLTLPLAAGVTLAFADSSSLPWAGTLNITGTFVPGSSIKFGNSSGGLLAGQRALISVNGSGAGTYTLDTNGFLISGGGDPYTTWAAGFLPTDVSSKVGNNDSDALTNLQEYAFGTDPTVSTGEIVYSGGTLTTPGAPKIVAAAGTYSMVFGRRADYVAAGLTYTVQFSADLVTWVDNDDVANVPAQVATDGTINAMSVPFVNFITTPSGSQKPTFARVKVVQAP